MKKCYQFVFTDNDLKDMLKAYLKSIGITSDFDVYMLKGIDEWEKISTYAYNSKDRIRLEVDMKDDKKEVQSINTVTAPVDEYDWGCVPEGIM